MIGLLGELMGDLSPEKMGDRSASQREECRLISVWES
jgi:hypothetical protein